MIRGSCSASCASATRSRAAVVTIASDDERLERRRGELLSGSIRRRVADPVADLDLAQAPELPDLTRRDGRSLDGEPLLEHRERGHLALEVAAESQQITYSQGPGEHPDVRDLLAACAALDLEDRRRKRAVRISG